MSKWKHLDAKGRKKQTDDDMACFMGALVILVSIIGLAWLGFMGWLLYTLAEWLVHQ